MSATSDVLSGGVGGSPFLSGKEAIRTISGDSTTLTSASFNQSTPVILKQTTEFGRDRIPNGTTAGDFLNIIVDESSEIYRIEGATARDSGYFPLTLALMPGARGYLRWDGSEWLWKGTGEIWWPLPKNRPDGPVATTLGYTRDSGMPHLCAYGDEGVIMVFRDTADATRIYGRVFPFGSDGQNDAAGFETLLYDEAANVVGDFALWALSKTVFILTWEDTTSAMVEGRVITRNGATLTVGTSIVTFTNASNGRLATVVGTRANATSFMFGYGGGVFTTNYPGFAYCTITGEGAAATITMNTPTEISDDNVFAGSDAANVWAHHFICEDPSRDEYYWAVANGHKSGSATGTHLTLFHRNGTSTAVDHQWKIQRTASYAYYYVAPVEGEDRLFTQSTQSGGAVQIYQPDATTPKVSKFSRLNCNLGQIANIRSLGGGGSTYPGGIYGGVVYAPYATYNSRWPKPSIIGSLMSEHSPVANSSSVSDSLHGQGFFDAHYVNTTANYEDFDGDNLSVTQLSPLGASTWQMPGNDSHGVSYMAWYTSAAAAAFIVLQNEVPTASGWKT